MDLCASRSERDKTTFIWFSRSRRITIITHTLTHSYVNATEINKRLSFWFLQKKNFAKKIRDVDGVTKKHSKHPCKA